MLNEPHIVTPTSAELVNFNTDMVAPLKECKVHFSPVQDGTGDPSPDNVRPISGWTSVNVTRCGKNLFDKTTVQAGYIDDADGQLRGSVPYKSTDYIRVVGGNSYYIVSEQTSSMWGAWYDEDKNYISGIVYYANKVITAPSNALHVRFTIKGSATGNVDTFAVNYPSTDHEYHAYTGTSYPVSWQSAGMIYGGTLDATTGVLTVDRELITLDGIANKITGEWGNTQYGSALYFTTIGNKSLFLNTISNVLQYSNASYRSMPLYSFTGSSGADKTCTIILPTGTTKDQGNQWLQDMVSAGTPVQVIRLLASVATYQLIPIEVKTLRGINNLWSTGNGDAQVTYWTH